MGSASMAYAYLMGITPKQLSECWFFNDFISIAQIRVNEYQELKDISFNHNIPENWNLIYDKLLSFRKEKFEAA